MSSQVTTGPWSKRWIWLDGIVSTLAIVEENAASLAVTGITSARGDRKIGETVPFRIELRIESDRLDYILKVDRARSARDLIESSKEEIVYALVLGEYPNEWIWKYAGIGSLKLSRQQDENTAEQESSFV